MNSSISVDWAFFRFPFGAGASSGVGGGGEDSRTPPCGLVSDLASRKNGFQLFFQLFSTHNVKPRPPTFIKKQNNCRKQINFGKQLLHFGKEKPKKHQKSLEMSKIFLMGLLFVSVLGYNGLDAGKQLVYYKQTTVEIIQRDM